MFPHNIIPQNPMNGAISDVYHAIKGTKVKTGFVNGFIYLILLLTPQPPPPTPQITTVQYYIGGKQLLFFTHRKVKQGYDYRY